MEAWRVGEVQFVYIGSDLEGEKGAKSSEGE